MSKTASIGLLPSSTLFGRLMASIDRLLIASSRIAVRNGDLPLFRSLSLKIQAFLEQARSDERSRLRSSGPMAPVFRGHFFVRPATALTTNCDKSARTAIWSHNTFAYWHIKYKYAFQRSYQII